MKFYSESERGDIVRKRLPKEDSSTTIKGREFQLSWFIKF